MTFRNIVLAIVGVSLMVAGCAKRRVAVPAAPAPVNRELPGVSLHELSSEKGGELQIEAPQQWCRDAGYRLEVRWEGPRRVGQRIATAPAGASRCTWAFDRMPAGYYDILLLARVDDRIVATGQGELSPGGTALVTLESAQTQVEGRIFSRNPLPSPLRLVFTVNSGAMFHPWRTPVAADGSYRVTLGDIGERTMVWVYAEPDGPARTDRPPSAFGAYQIATLMLSRGGVHHYDLDDVDLPPVVLSVNVPPAATAPVDELMDLRLDPDPKSQGTGTAFKLRGGFRGQFLARYGEHTVVVSTYESRERRASSTITLRSPVRQASITVQIPPPQ